MTAFDNKDEIWKLVLIFRQLTEDNQKLVIAWIEENQDTILTALVSQKKAG